MMKQEFTRKELYALVWSKPLTTLATQFKISDNELRKICKKYNIPLPKAGHWQKKLYGKKLHVRPLPEDEKMSDARISLGNGKHHFLTGISQLTKQIQEDSSLPIQVPEKLHKPDILVKEAKKVLTAEKASTNGVHRGIVFTAYDTLNIEVSPGNIRRALRFMDALIKLIKTRGHSIEVGGYETFFIIHDEKFKVRCREKLKRVIVKDKHWDYSELVPTGKLSFRIDGFNPREWQDDGKMIENKLARILATLEIRAREEKIQRIEINRRRKEQEEQQQIELKRKAKREWEEKKISMLLAHANQWDQAENLKAFIQEIGKRKEINNKPDGNLEEWIKWAKDTLKMIDPLSRGVESLIENYTK